MGGLGWAVIPKESEGHYGSYIGDKGCQFRGIVREWGEVIFLVMVEFYRKLQCSGWN